MKLTSISFPSNLVNLYENNYISINAALTFIKRKCVPLITGNTRREHNVRLTESLTSDGEVGQVTLIGRIGAFGVIS